MNNFERAKAFMETAENTLVTGHWGGQVYENQELGCFEASFVIELDGIGFSSSGKWMPVSPTNADDRDELTFRKFQEGHL